MLQAIYSITDSNLLQSDLNSLYGWSVDNLLSFSIKKCIVLRFKCNFNIATDYSIETLHFFTAILLETAILHGILLSNFHIYFASLKSSDAFLKV